ncbi:MAG: VOC family protein [Actinomycetota bacterium]
MGNPVVHFEIMGVDGDALGRFYTEVFGWDIQSMPETNYGLVDTRGGEGVNGGIATTEPGRTGVAFYVEVPDTDTMLRSIEAAGGTIVMPTTSIPGVVTFAMFRDPQGNHVGLVRNEGGTDPAEGRPADGDGAPVSWFEVLGPDGAGLRDFYGRLFGWTFKVNESFDYAEVDTGAARGIPGGIGTHPEGKTAVTVYARVDDLGQTLKGVEAEGGTTVMPPMNVGEGTEVAQFADPQGNVFGLFRSA